MRSMATRLSSDPELASIVERARSQASAAGELRNLPPERLASVLNASAREVVASWVGGGGYDQALTEVIAEDPDLADQ